MVNMKRIFVGNLPKGTIEKDIETEFSAYGTVSKVEVKHKRDPFTNEVMSTFAFVTISIADTQLNQCLTEFQNETFRGQYLTVSVARENFMEKLKREREECSQGPSLNGSNADTSVNQIEKPRIKKNVEVIQAISSDSDSSDSSVSSREKSSVEPEIIVKRKSKLFTENGKIKIPSVDNKNLAKCPNDTPTTVLQKKFDEKSQKADQKRLDSLAKMKNTYVQQKKAVQQALSNIDTTQNKKIIFDMPQSESKNTSKPLFDDDDDEDDDFDYKKNFEIKKQYQGEKGARLQKLQSKFQNDQRFNMNEKFLDDNEDGDVEEEEYVADGAESKTDERKWQYDMLESVMGKKIQPNEKKKSDKPMLRYDPTKNDHVQYEKVMKRKIPNNDADSEPAKLRKLNNETDFEVSKEQYYKVTNQLTSSLQPSSEGFSLLSMFGRGTDHVDVEQRNPYKEILLTKGQQKLVASNNTFHDESSDEEIIQERWTKAKDLSVNDSKQTKKTAKSEIWHEPFFIFGNDQRLQDGLSFFMPNSSNQGAPEEFENKQREMRNIIKKKIKKSIKSVIPRGGKPNKRFGRLVKNV